MPYQVLGHAEGRCVAIREEPSPFPGLHVCLDSDDTVMKETYFDPKTTTTGRTVAGGEGSVTR